MNKDLDIIGLINKYVQEIAKDNWKKDECPPEFWVSVYGYGDEQKIMITVNHLGSKFTEVLFPIKDATYGYDSLLTEMKYLYNRTM